MLHDWANDMSELGLGQDKCLAYDRHSSQYRISDSVLPLVCKQASQGNDQAQAYNEKVTLEGTALIHQLKARRAMPETRVSCTTVDPNFSASRLERIIPSTNGSDP